MKTKFNGPKSLYKKLKPTASFNLSAKLSHPKWNYEYEKLNKLPKWILWIQFIAAFYIFFCIALPPISAMIGYPTDAFGIACFTITMTSASVYFGTWIGWQIYRSIKKRELIVKECQRILDVARVRCKYALVDWNDELF